MSDIALFKLESAELPVVRARAALSDEAAPLLAGCADVPAALAALTRGGRPHDAAKLLAQAMPRREAVWWACMCARHTRPRDLPAEDEAALEAAELWVRKPTDENRRAAFARAEQAGFATPESWACVAAFWSGGSMSPVEQPAVPPAPHLAGVAVAGSVALALVRTDPSRQAKRIEAFLRSAREIAAGGTGRLPAEQG